ncbi:MAG: hypothetical protein K0S39_719 [Paenibacillus sp.]|jgi:hypothetical protein|nr:hypothetical protein [Paenibacillus sp.]
MRESSYNLSKQNSQQPKDIRGGEKKVMKKSLSTILSLAMAFSMFSSVALAADAAKTSADFSDLKDLDAATKAKFDSLISAGVFDGVSEGVFGLKDEMNRAQFAKVAALIFNLKVDTSLKTSSFKDVKADDPANGYALPYIEAVKAAGITDGYAPGEFNPAGKVTKEQLAAFLIRGINKDADAKATPGVNDSTVSDWAKGYVALALNLKLLSNGADGKFGGTTNATRDLLVLGAYEGKQQYRGPAFDGKYAIASLKATDANVLTLELNGALTEDAAKNLKIEVKKDGSAVTSGFTTKWDDKKTIATLTFDSKFGDNKFDVTISGVSNINDTAKTASVTTTKEKITKIDFLTASETIPLAVDDKDNDGDQDLLHKVRVDFKATNQYGAQSKLNASNFDIRVNGGEFSTIAGEQAINISQDLDTERNDRISITVLHEESGVQASKIFTVGDEALVSKVEVGELLNSAGTKIEEIEALGYAYLDTKAYDQYGFIVEDLDILNDGISVSTSDSDLEVGDNDDEAYVDDVVGSDAADLKLRSTENEAKEITVSVFARGGQSVTKTLKIGTSKIPATVEFGSYNYTLAEGDVQTHDEAVDNKFFVPIVVKDAKGELLDADDIVDAFDDEKFDIDSTSGLDLASVAIARSGSHKGMIEIEKADRTGNQTITVALEDIPTQRATFSVNVGEKREAQEIKFSTTPKKYMVAGSDNEVKFKIYDQHGSEMKYDDNDEFNYKVELAYKLNSTSVAGADQTFFSAKEKVASGDRAFKLVVPVAGQVDNPATVTEETYNTSVSSFNLVDSTTGATDLFWNNFFDKSFKFYSVASSPEASYTLKATLYKQEVGETAWEEVDNVSTTVEVIDPTKTENKLTYEVYLDKGVNNNTILASEDYLDLNDTTVNNATYIFDNLKKFSKEVKVRAKKSSGEEVSIKTDVKSITSSNKNVIDVPVNAGVQRNFVVGLEQGTADVNVVFVNAKGDRETQKVTVNTKNEAPAVASIALKKTEKTIAAGNITGKYLWDRTLAEKITVKDQYGDEIVSEFAPGDDNEERSDADQFLVKDGSIGQNHNSVLNLSFYISDVVYSGTDTTADTVEINNGKLTYTNNGAKNITSFTVNVLAPSGVAASFDVIVTP